MSDLETDKWWEDWNDRAGALMQELNVEEATELNRLVETKDAMGFAEYVRQLEDEHGVLYE